MILSRLVLRSVCAGGLLLGGLMLPPAARADTWQPSGDGCWYYWSDGAQRWYWTDGTDWFVDSGGRWVKCPPRGVARRSLYAPVRGSVNFPYGSVSWGAGGQVTFPYGAVSWGPRGGYVVFPFGSVAWPGGGRQR